MSVETSKGPLDAVGPYELLDKIAEGGMGTVYKGRNRNTGEIVAVKIVPSHLVSNSILLKRFEQEYNAAKKVDHPNIVRAIDFGKEGNTPYLVMEYVHGESLGQRILREGRLPETEAIRIMGLVAQGLHKAHKHGLIHRDVKPDNVLLGPEGQVKITDLGLVKIKEVEQDQNLTRTGRGLGTPHFMAPEQFRNAKNASVRCDIYSLGATLYMTVTGEMPFKSCSPLDAWIKKVHNEFMPARELVPELSERMDWAIRRAMSADPEQRPATCREFVEDLTGRSTRKTLAIRDNGASHEWFYLYYKDEDGTEHTVKGSMYAIRRSLKEGLLGDASNIRAGRNKAGPFELLRSYPEFRDLIVSPAALPMPQRKPAESPPAPVPETDSSLSGANKTPPPKPASPARAAPAYVPPKIDLPTASSGLDFWTWLLMGVVALSTALVALYYFMRK